MADDSKIDAFGNAGVGAVLGLIGMPFVLEWLKGDDSLANALLNLGPGYVLLCGGGGAVAGLMIGSLVAESKTKERKTIVRPDGSHPEREPSADIGDDRESCQPVETQPIYEFACSCGAVYRVAERFLGRPIRCVRCKKPTRIPSTCMVSCKCGATKRVSKKLAGKTVACTECSGFVLVPKL